MSEHPAAHCPAPLQDIFDKIAVETGNLARYNKKPTVTSREIQTAVRLILPGAWLGCCLLSTMECQASKPGVGEATGWSARDVLQAVHSMRFEWLSFALHSQGHSARLVAPACLSTDHRVSTNHPPPACPDPVVPPLPCLQVS